MRKRRVIISDNDPHLRNEVAQFFAARGYDTVVFSEPLFCPAYGGSEDCKGPRSCCDIMITGLDSQIMNAVELIVTQNRRGCKLPAANKAIIAESLPDDRRAALASMGIALFLTPLVVCELERWVEECETRMDLELPVALRRREERREARNEMMSFLMPGNRLARASVVNKSTCGVCFKTSHQLTTNDMIMLRTDSHGKSEDAVVRWVRPAGKDKFIVGISYCI